MTKKQSTPDFEDALQSLEGLVEQLEKGELSLEQSLSAFEDGIKLTRSCQEALQSAEQRVNVLIEKNGSEALQAYVAEQTAGDAPTS